MNKKALIFVIFVVALTVVLAYLLASQPKPSQKDQNNSLNLTRRSQGIKPLSENTRIATQQDQAKLKEILTKDPLETEDFRLRYEEKTKQFVVDLYTKTREESLNEIYTYLEEQGIKEPDKLPLAFNGPYGYDDYEMVPQEKIDEIMKRYNK